MLLVILVYIAASVLGNTVFTSSIETCHQNSEGLNCVEKMFLLAEVSYGISTTFDAVTFTELTKDGEPQAMEDSMRVSLTASPPELNYALNYLHKVPYFPHEEVIKVQNSFPGIQKCEDSWNVQYPSCGWTYLGSQKILDSQGFCCNKDLEMLTAPAWWRGEVLLGSKSNLINSFSTAHCLRLGDLYYYGYEVVEPIKSFQITVEVDKGGSIYTFQVNPENPFYATYNQPGFQNGTDPNLYVKLIGSYPAYTSAPDLDNELVYIPATPAGHEYVENYPDYMIMLQREQASWDGSECNKVGIGFNTFRMQKGFCDSSVAGDCLHNQLKHYYNSDLISYNANNDYNCPNLMKCNHWFEGTMSFSTGMQQVLKYSVTEISFSEVHVMMDMAQIRLITTESKGVIIEAWVDPFESHTKNGLMNVIVRNIGDLKTDYAVTVLNCNMNILSTIPAAARTMQPGDDKRIKFRIYTTYNLDTSNACWVYLRSIEGKLYDSVEVFFDTYKHRSDFSFELQQKNEESESNSEDFFGFGSCDCGFFDIPCKFIKLCWLDILIMIGIVLAIIAAIICVVIFILAGGPQYLFPFLCGFMKSCECGAKLMNCFTKSMVKEGLRSAGKNLRGGIVGVAGGKKKKKKKKKRRKKRRKKKKKKKDKELKPLKPRNDKGSREPKRDREDRRRDDRRDHRDRRDDRRDHHHQRRGPRKEYKRQRVDDGRYKKGRRYDDEEVSRKLYPQPDAAPGRSISQKKVNEFCENNTVCYMNVNTDTIDGKEMYDLLCTTMPMKIGPNFSMIGRIRFKHDVYQFIIHEMCLSQTLKYDKRKGWVKGGKEIKKQYMGYNLPPEDGVCNVISEHPWKHHKVINAPPEDGDSEEEGEEEEDYPKPDFPAEHNPLAEETVKEFCESSTVCYMNVNTGTEHGREMYDILKNTMPLPVGPNFCLVGKIRFKRKVYQFIIHETCLSQTWKYEGSDWMVIDDGESGEIKKKYMGYNLPEGSVYEVIGQYPWKNHKVINLPPGDDDSEDSN